MIVSVTLEMYTSVVLDSRCWEVCPQYLNTLHVAYPNGTGKSNRVSRWHQYMVGLNCGRVEPATSPIFAERGG